MKKIKVWIGEYPYKENRGWSEIYDLTPEEYIKLIETKSWTIGTKYLHLRGLLNTVYIEIL